MGKVAEGGVEFGQGDRDLVSQFFQLRRKWTNVVHAVCRKSAVMYKKYIHAWEKFRSEMAQWTIVKYGLVINLKI